VDASRESRGLPVRDGTPTISALRRQAEANCARTCLRKSRYSAGLIGSDVLCAEDNPRYAATPGVGGLVRDTLTVLERLHHVQLAMPRGEEDAARKFFVAGLGMTELEKPPVLAARGGAWFRSGVVELHLGVEEPFAPARRDTRRRSRQARAQPQLTGHRG
jgi:hypothetical protein